MGEEQEELKEEPPEKPFFLRGGSRYPSKSKGPARLFPEQADGDRVVDQLMYVPEDYQGEYFGIFICSPCRRHFTLEPLRVLMESQQNLLFARFLNAVKESEVFAKDADPFKNLSHPIATTWLYKSQKLHLNRTKTRFLRTF